MGRFFKLSLSFTLSLFLLFGVSEPVDAKVKEEVSIYESYKIFEAQSGIDVTNELVKMREQFQVQLENSKDDKIISQLLLQIEQINNSLALINNLEYQSLNKNESVLPSSEIGVNCNIHVTQAALIIAYFNSKGYSLAAELLNYAFINTSRSTVYNLSSTHVSKIYSTSWFATINGKYPVSGSNRFTSGDLYYAINKFNFGPNSSYGYIDLTDIYDYSLDQSYPTIQGVAVNAMVWAQSVGCLVPYTVKATLKTK